MILAGIDIGSNAARLLLCEVTESNNGKPVFTKLNLVRVPLRLGMDVFATGSISAEKTERFIATLKAYRFLMKAYGVTAFKACATSAMRDAENGAAVLQRLEKETGIQIQIISGQEEAGVIYETHAAENLSSRKNYLYIDVGGGSTELTCFSKGRLVQKESFNLGTIRLLQGSVKKEEWEALRQYVKLKIRRQQPLEAIGSGGNINKVFSLSKKKEGQPLKLELLQQYYETLSGLSVAERMQRFNLRADRADVIVPALEIYLNVMRWAGTDEIVVPKIGLADGLVRMLYEQVRKGALANGK